MFGSLINIKYNKYNKEVNQNVKREEIKITNQKSDVEFWYELIIKAKNDGYTVDQVRSAIHEMVKLKKQGKDVRELIKKG